MKQILQSLGSGATELEEVPVPAVTPKHLVVETRASAVSPGTERMLVEFGRSGLLDKARRQPDRVREVLDKLRTDGLGPTVDAVRSKLDRPIPLGYCNAGVVRRVRKGAERFMPGDRVVTNGSHAEYVRVPWTLAARIPDEVSFEAAAFAHEVGTNDAVAVASGTAALHLALRLTGVGPEDEVLVPSFTFVASVNPIAYLGARPVFLDSERRSWNLDPNLLEEALRARARSGRLPAALVVVHLYGQTADLDPILRLCREFEVPVVEDAAEALGARYGRRSPGGFGRAGIFSFNGNKIITTSGGGMLATDDADLAARARKLATQARDPAPHYEHTEMGYNYRLSNLLAAVGRAQLRVLHQRVTARRAVFDRYRKQLGDLPGLTFQPEAPWGVHTRWLTCLLVDEKAFGADRETIRQALEEENIEARPLWKPMHLQPLYKDCEVYGGGVAESLFRQGLCLPSGSSLTEADQDRVIETVRRVAASSTSR
jgi:dTDP-4-amino-4,6-dideoxygalactose transaminase